MTDWGLDDDMLMAFADGELDAKGRETVERAMAEDEAVAERVQMFIATRTRAKEAFEPMLKEPVPDALTSKIKDMVAASDAASAQEEPDKKPDNVTVLQPKRDAVKPRGAPYWSLPLAASIALIAGAAAGFILGRGGDGQTGATHLAMLNAPAFSTALEEVPSGDERPFEVGGRFRAIASFRDDDGTFCREFELDESNGSTIVGVACHEAEDWQMRFSVVAGQTDAGYAPASSLEALDAYLSAVGAGEPLSSEDEAAALRALD